MPPPPPGKERDSNIELLRIIAMFFVVAHHYVVNSGVLALFDCAHPCSQRIWLELFGMWGKTAINSFVLISGYFLCTSSLTIRKFLKLIVAVEFWKVILWIVMCIAGYEDVNFRAIRNLFLWPFAGANNGFVPAFLWMYAFVPFLNKIIHAFDRRSLHLFVGLMLALFVGCSHLGASNVFHYVGWYVCLYFMGAIIRLCPMKWMGNVWVSGWLLGAAVLLAIAWVFFYDFACPGQSWGHAWWLIANSNRILAVLVGVLAFLFFKNIRLGHSRMINIVASTTFGILLIHGANDGMRTWLWGDVVNVVGHYQSQGLLLFVAYSVFSVTGVFVICSVLDYLRIRWLEEKLLTWTVAAYDGVVSVMRRRMN